MATKKTDPRPRKERRADPARWYKIEGGFASESEEIVNLPEGVCVYGQISDVIVITYPADATPQDKYELLLGTKEVVERAGIKKHVVVVPNSVNFLKLRPLTKTESAKVERARKAKAMGKLINAGKSGGVH